MCKSVLKMNHVVDVVTKTVNLIRARALNHRQFVALLEENETEHRDISYHTTVRWLSLGKVLKGFWDLTEEIREFCVKKGNGILQLSDADWLADLGFAVDVTAQMNELNVKLQCKGLFGHMVSSPFTCSEDNAPSDVQMELIDLQSDTLLAEYFKSVPLLEFYSSLKEENFPLEETCSEDSSPLWIYLRM